MFSKPAPPAKEEGLFEAACQTETELGADLVGGAARSGPGRRSALGLALAALAVGAFLLVPRHVAPWAAPSAAISETGMTSFRDKITKQVVFTDAHNTELIDDLYYKVTGTFVRSEVAELEIDLAKQAGLESAGALSKNDKQKMVKAYFGELAKTMNAERRKLLGRTGSQVAGALIKQDCASVYQRERAGMPIFIEISGCGDNAASGPVFMYVWKDGVTETTA